MGFNPCGNTQAHYEGQKWGSPQIIPRESQFSISATKKKQLLLRHEYIEGHAAKGGIQTTWYNLSSLSLTAPDLSWGGALQPWERT